MRIIFMGTPDFATGTLQALYDAGHKIVMAVTQPDKPAGRGKNLQSTDASMCTLRSCLPGGVRRRSSGLSSRGIKSPV